eukprot:TRINITY_DN74080_c0_g1_i1.p1 TRINITY_DN74080_c0_g1~~TRINITY_DN74080_c0_g1_i1.p1  ORF type:complete len:976 (-),score=178.05 TRINITY_DN74080_c0_g1_i1:254-3181(-)
MGIFTRDASELLSYDGDAFYYFALTLLSFVVFPWSWFLFSKLSDPRPVATLDYDSRQYVPAGATVRRCRTSMMEAKRDNSITLTRSWGMRLGNYVCHQLILVSLLWFVFGAVICQIRDLPMELRSFDPHQILEIERSADLKQIKKAYRLKSLKHHPDKNQDNPLASVLFQDVSRAYAALTDENARRNYETYGNPDGPAQMKVGIALHPSMLLSKQVQLVTLVTFFSVLFGVPLILLCCCLGPGMSRGFVSKATIQIYQTCIDIDVRAEDGPALLAAAEESHGMRKGSLDRLIAVMASKWPATAELGCSEQITGEKSSVEVGEQGSRESEAPLETIGHEPGLPCMFSNAPIRRTTFLIWAHIKRLHEHMDVAAQSELAELLTQSVTVGRAMAFLPAANYGSRSGFFEVIREMVIFRRCLVQAISMGADALLQLPHVDKVPENSPTLRDVVTGSGGSFLDSLGLNKSQRLDVDEFIRNAPQIELSCNVYVDDEDLIVEGDVATLDITLTRLNLNEAEAAGYVHAPLFPVPKFEEWWLLLYDDRERRLVTVEVLLGRGRTEKSRIRFQLPSKGQYQWSVHAMCDSFEGLDVVQTVSFTAIGKNEVDRTIFIHPADMKIRTFFEELMLGTTMEEESDSESDVDGEQTGKGKESSLVAEATPKSTIPAEAAAQVVEDSDDEYVAAGNQPVGSYFAVKETNGVCVYRTPAVDPQFRRGSVPCRSVLRGHVGEGRPSGWLELAGSAGLWVFIGGTSSQEKVEETVGGRVEESEAEEKAADDHREEAPVGSDERPEDAGDEGPHLVCLGELAEQKLQTVIECCGPVPLWLVRQWLRQSKGEIDAKDFQQVMAIGDPKMRSSILIWIRSRCGDERYSQLQDEAEEIRQKSKARLSKALGYFRSQNGIIWRIAPSGMVRGIRPDGAGISDNIDVSDDGEIRLGHYVLDKSKACACLHWNRKGDSPREWIWRPDRSLNTRVRLNLA